MSIKKLTQLTLVGCLCAGLFACGTTTTSPTQQPAKAPKNVCEPYEAKVAGMKDALAHTPINYEYADTNNCPYDTDRINEQYLAGYAEGKNMKP